MEILPRRWLPGSTGWCLARRAGRQQPWQRRHADAKGRSSRCASQQTPTVGSLLTSPSACPPHAVGGRPPAARGSRAVPPCAVRERAPPHAARAVGRGRRSCASGRAAARTGRRPPGRRPARRRQAVGERRRFPVLELAQHLCERANLAGVVAASWKSCRRRAGFDADEEEDVARNRGPADLARTCVRVSSGRRSGDSS